MQGQINTPSGILSFGPNLLGVQVYAIIKFHEDDYRKEFPIFVRKALEAEVKELA